TPASAKNAGKNTPEPNKDVREPLSKKKLSYKEQRELDGLPALIQQLESQQKAIEQELFDGTLYTTNAKRAAELNARNTKIEEELMAALQRWETLSS
ncbi:ABC transporter C-terminal domain-containing protein, partial [Neisseria gonorrhoeae]